MVARQLKLDPETDTEAVAATPFKGRRRPGPQSANAPLEPERDLADAALMIDLVGSGAMKTGSGKEIPNSTLENIAKQPSKRLTLEDEIQLTQLVQTHGDVDARNMLVMANMGLVHLVANQYFRPPMRYEDLLQEGTMGLIRATETFEPNRAVRFSTYSVYWIRAKIQRLIQRIEKDDIPNITGADAESDQDGRKKRKPRARKLSIDKSSDEDSRSLSEILANDTENPEDLALKTEKEKAIHEILNEIVDELGDPRLKTVIEWRLLAEEPETLTQLGDRLNLSREGARMLESKMLRLARQRLATWKKRT